MLNVVDERGGILELNYDHEGKLIVDYQDLFDLQRMLNDGTDINGCIESLFIVCVIEPTFVKKVKMSSEPNEEQREFVEFAIQAIQDYVIDKQMEKAN